MTTLIPELDTARGVTSPHGSVWVFVDALGSAEPDITAHATLAEAATYVRSHVPQCALVRDEDLPAALAASDGVRVLRKVALPAPF